MENSKLVLNVHRHVKTVLASISILAFGISLIYAYKGVPSILRDNMPVLSFFLMLSCLGIALISSLILLSVTVLHNVKSAKPNLPRTPIPILNLHFDKSKQIIQWSNMALDNQNTIGWLVNKATGQKIKILTITCVGYKKFKVSLLLHSNQVDIYNEFYDLEDAKIAANLEMSKWFDELSIINTSQHQKSKVTI